MAVGYADDAGTIVTLAEASNGAGWSIQSTPNPMTTGFMFPSLAGVSCPSPTMCIAVGRTVVGNTTSLSAERYS
jgi:hypothetical protein